MNNNHYNKSHKGLAKALRFKMTKAEACLWKYGLRANKRGIKFRRQRPIDQYIVDFVYLPLKLVIEVDGLTHQYPEVIENDKLRAQRLRKLGFTILRFEDSDILNDINGVIRNIDYEIENLQNCPPPPIGTSSQGG